MLQLTALGGLGEIGLNAMAVETADDIVLVDAGLMFAGPDLPGVGVVVPDFHYLLERRERVRAVVLTHGHEDHLGALPYLLRQLQVPVYGTPFTLALAGARCEELGVSCDLRPMAPREAFAVGGLSVEPLRVAHSIPDGVGLVLRSGPTTVIHTGDFKLDPTPTDGRTTDLERLGELGDEGVSALLSDSTNAEEPGEAGSEQEVAATFERLFRAAPGRLVVALFASHLGRVQHVFDTCKRLDRCVIPSGRALLRNLELGRRLGLLQFSDAQVAPVEAARSLPPGRVLILTTGSQAEPRSGLAQMAFDPEAALRVQAGDTFILSARTIPGNERAVSRLVSQLMERGATVFHGRSGERIHVSGHAAQAEQRTVLERVRPKAFVPIHGEMRHLVRHLATARAAGVWADGALLARDGDLIRVDENRARVEGTVPCGRVYREAQADAAVSPAALEERLRVAAGGLLVVTAVIDRTRRTLAAPPQVSGKGLSLQEEAALPAMAAAALTDLSALSGELLHDDALVEDALIRAVRRVAREGTGRRPAVMPVVFRV